MQQQLELQCPEGTIVTRLARARARLRQRLSQRGVTLSIGSLSGAIDRYAVPAAVSTETIRAVTVAAWQFGVGPAVACQAIHAESVLLAKGVLKTMVLTKMKTAAILITGLVAVAGGTASYQKLLAGQGDEKANRVAATTRDGSQPQSAEFPPPPANEASQPPSSPGGFVAGIDNRNVKAPTPYKIWTFYTPLFEGGAIGQPVPFSVEINGVPAEEARELMARFTSSMKPPLNLDPSQTNEKAVKPLRFTASYEPVFEGGAIGEPVPFTVEISNLPEQCASLVRAEILESFPRKDVAPGNEKFEPGSIEGQRETSAPSPFTCVQAALEYVLDPLVHPRTPLRFTTSYQPNLKGVATGQPIPFTIQISGLRKKALPL